MRARRLLVLTALVSSILGGVAAYLVLTVPNDLQAGALLKDARARMAEGKTAEAQDALSKIVQQYPRTDAAAAAIVALVTLEEQQRRRLQSEIAALRRTQEAQAKTLAEMQKAAQTERERSAAAAAAAAAAAERERERVAAAEKARQTATAKKSTKKRPTRKTTTRRRR